MTPDDDVISRKAAMKAASAAVMQPWDWRGNEHDFQLWNAGAKMAFDNVSKVPAAAPVVPSEPLEWFFNDLPHPFWYAQDEDESGLFSIVKGRTGTLGADMWTLMLGDITLFGADDPEYLKNRAQQIQDAIKNASPVTQWTRESVINELEMFRLALVDCIAHPAERYDEPYDIESYRAGAKMAYSGALNVLIGLRDALLLAHEQTK